MRRWWMFGAVMLAALVVIVAAAGGVYMVARNISNDRVQRDSARAWMEVQSYCYSDIYGLNDPRCAGWTEAILDSGTNYAAVPGCVRSETFFRCMAQAGFSMPNK